MKNPSSFSERLQVKRKDLGWTQDELAEKSGISKRSIVAYESDSPAKPNSENLQKLAKALGVSETWLLNGIEQLKYQPASGTPQSLQESAGVRQDCHRYLDRVLDVCPDRDQMIWTYIELKRHFPVHGITLKPEGEDLETPEAVQRLKDEARQKLQSLGQKHPHPLPPGPK